MRVSIPLTSDLARLKRGFLLSCLRSIYRNSQELHDVIVVSQDANEPEFQSAIEEWPVRLVHCDGPFHSDLDSRLYEFLNIGARAADTEWLLSPTGDDSFFFPNWECLLEAVTSAKAAREIWVPSILETGSSADFRVTIGRPTEIRISTPLTSVPVQQLLDWRNTHVVDKGLLTEAPNERKTSHWAHTVQHRDLYWKAGGFREEPRWPDSHDLHLHDDYTKLGVEKICVSRSCIGNCKVPIGT